MENKFKANELAVPEKLQSVFEQVQMYHNARGGKKAAKLYSRHERHESIIDELKELRTTELTVAEWDAVHQVHQKEKLETKLTEALERLLDVQLKKQLESLNKKQASLLVSQLKAMIMGLGSDDENRLDARLKKLFGSDNKDIVNINDIERVQLMEPLKTILMNALILGEKIEMAQENPHNMPSAVKELRLIRKGGVEEKWANFINNTLHAHANMPPQTMYLSNELLDKAERIKVLEERLQNALSERKEETLQGNEDEKRAKINHFIEKLSTTPVEEQLKLLEKELYKDLSVHNGQHLRAHLSRQLMNILTSTPSQTPALLKEFRETIPSDEKKIEKFVTQVEQAIFSKTTVKTVIPDEAKKSSKKEEPAAAEEKTPHMYSKYLKKVLENPLLTQENKVVQLFRLIFFKKLDDKDDLNRAKAEFIQLGDEATLKKIPNKLQQAVGSLLDKIKRDKVPVEHAPVEHKYSGIKSDLAHSPHLKSVVENPSLSQENKVVKLFQLIVSKVLHNNKEDLNLAKAIFVQLGNDATLKKMPDKLQSYVGSLVEKIKLGKTKEPTRESTYLEDLVANPKVASEIKVVQLYRHIFFGKLDNKAELKSAKAELVLLGTEETLNKLPANVHRSVGSLVDKIKEEQANKESQGTHVMKRFKEVVKTLSNEHTAEPSPTGRAPR